MDKELNRSEDIQYLKNLYEATLNNLDEIVHIVNKEMKILFANKAIENLSRGKIKQKDIIGKNLYDVFPFLKEKGVDKEYEKVFSTGKPLKTEEWADFHKEKIFTATTKFPIKDEKGNVIQIITVMRDLTERKRTEEELKESEEKYRSLVENLNVGVYRNTPGPKGKFIEANPAIIKMFGYNREEFFKINVSDLYQNPEDRKKFNEKILKNGFVRNEELRLKKKDGTPIWASVTAIAVYDENGEVRHYDGIIEDITLRKKAEEEAKYQKRYFQALFNGSPEGIVSLDEQFKVVDINPAFQDIFGYTLEDIKGKNLDDYILPKKYEKEGRRLSKKVMNGEIVVTESVRKRKDGSEIHVSILGAPIFINGKEVGIFAIYRDITERKKAEEELKKAYKEVERALKQERKFKTDTAHYFFNLLCIAEGYLHLTVDKLSPKEKEKIEKALQALKRIENVVGNVVKKGEIHE